MKIKPKKYLGQHFLKDENIAWKTALLTQRESIEHWLEIGPGTGMLTKQLLEQKVVLEVVEVDPDSIKFLRLKYPELKLHDADFLKLDLANGFPTPMGIIGNFPYNISSQIVFKILENPEQIPAFCGMFQLEVAQRLAGVPNNKSYGILSVLAQAYYDIDVEFQIEPSAFNPPPKVQSAVIYAKRHHRELKTDRAMFFEVVKTAFQQRRKMLSNALGKYNLPEEGSELHHLLKLRAENLSVEQFVLLSNSIIQNTVKHG